MKIKIVSLLLILLMAFTSIGCSLFPDKMLDVNSSQTQTDNANGNQTADNRLQIVKSDMKLTQEDVASRIKAEYLIKQGGYKDSDPVVVMINLTGDSVIDAYNNGASNGSVADYANSASGKAQINGITARQNSLINTLESKKLISGVQGSYSVVMNAVAVTCAYGDIAKIEALNGVESVMLSDTFNRPQSQSGESGSAIRNLVDIYETGIYKSDSVPYTGKGTAVAILDSGFDCSHSVFAGNPAGDLMITQRTVSNFISNKAVNAVKNNRGGVLDLADVYYSNKIPFVYDYADKDADVFPYDSNHGTHVAGIIGGKDDVITGIAIDTQLVLMKVFPDLDSGADTTDIVSALEDAVLLGVDAINMSLGSSCGFAREADNDRLNAVYDSINETGISLITAASNSYSSAYGGELGNTNKVTNPDSGTVGSPSTYPAALSVASISGTMSKYMVANGSQVVFFKESNSVSGKENDFFGELGVDSDGEQLELEYVTIPGVGKKVNYSSFAEGELDGKIALVRRGDNTFEDKALQAKRAGAIACIIYNNVEGDIIMSMGKTDHIPTISISKEMGELLATKKTGTIKISFANQAGPFMSDFSSWGPTPSLELKPEITAHGGNIKSSVPGGGYDELSGTSMASPNLCGIVVLIRQYLKDNYSHLSTKEMSVMANQLLMSTATIIKNEEGNPYSPRKQGAGLASLFNAVNTKAYITVDGIDRSKLELKDDPKREGVYTMNFNVINLSNQQLTYDLSVIGMTESVSTSDDEFVSETPQILNGKGDYSVVEGGSLSGNKVTINANGVAKISVTYTLTDADKQLIDDLFPYGMYVEGFVKLTASEDNIDLNVPFLAFYGDWTEAPLFDKTYYEVESEAHDASIDEEDKLKADYYATTPYGNYYYNYIIPLGTYLYDIDTSVYDAIPATEEHVAISDILGTIDGIASVYAGLLRCAKTMTYTITDKVTGEVVFSLIDYNAQKAHFASMQIPYYDYFKMSSYSVGLINNRQYEFKMVGELDYGDGGLDTNKRNSFSFDFYMDNEAPVLREVTYEKEYDKALKKDRYYINMTVYDNHYVQSITPIIFTSSSSYTFLSENPIPVYSEKGADNKVKFEITEYLENICEDQIITSALAFSIDDYALNSNLYICQLPGTKGDFKFTKDGTPEGSDLIILSMYEGEVIDLTKFLSTTDGSVDESKDYLKYLQWTSSNSNVATVKDGLVKCVSAGKATVTATEQMELKQAILIINVKPKAEDAGSTTGKVESNAQDANIKSLRFSHFETLFAYTRAAQTSEIGETGDTMFLSAMNGISFYPGEQVKLYHDLDPWYVADKYQLSYRSTNETVATVDQTGKVTALKEGNASIILSVEGSNISAIVNVNVKNEFVIENRMLIAYKGLGGDVVIPDDEGILYISSYAFCLYLTDNSIEITDDDYDANKIPQTNTTIKSVVIPEGVEEIQKYAFFNCTGLETVVIPDSVKFIREFAFYNDSKLKTIDLSNVEMIGANAFTGCSELNDIDLGKAYTIGINAFKDCKSLESVNITALRSAGAHTFEGCESLESVQMNKYTKLSYAMFARSGLVSIDIYALEEIPEYCFAQCEKLESVNLVNDLTTIGYGAFCECPELKTFTAKQVSVIAEQAFYKDTALNSFTLPNNAVSIGEYCFYECNSLEKIVFGANTVLSEVSGAIFAKTALSTFDVHVDNTAYSVSADGKLLLNGAGDKIILGATSVDFGDLVIDEKYVEIANSAFSGVKVKSVTIINPDTVIGAYAFAECDGLEKVVLPVVSGVRVGDFAFYAITTLTQVENLVSATELGEYAFSRTGLTKVELGNNVNVKEGAFFNMSSLEMVTLGANTVLEMGVFQNCKLLVKVIMPEEGGVVIGNACFAYDIKLNEIDLSKTSDTIANEAFYGCISLTKANLENVKVIGNYAFSDCKALLNVTMPIVEKIGIGAFARYDTYSGAPVIDKLVLPDTLTEIGDGAFLGCEGLTYVKFPETFETHKAEIGDGSEYNTLSFAFAYCINLEQVVLATGMESIGTYAFAGCERLAEINLENVKYFADYAFTSAKGLVSANLKSAETIGVGAFADTTVSTELTSDSLKEIAMYAFQGAKVTVLDAPNLEILDDASFDGNVELTKVVLPKSLKLFGSAVFIGCSALQNFAYIPEGDIYTANNGMVNQNIKLVEGVVYTKMKSGKWQLSAVPAGKNIKTLTVEEGTYRIDVFAGNQNKNIEKIILPDSLKLIGNYAFYGYDNLKTVEFKSVNAPALENYYNSTSVLEETAPGYNKLHEHFDLFGLELYYYNFMDLVGRNDPIEMILPANEKLSGYDSLVYEVYFGKVEDSKRSEYVAMQNEMILFLEYAEKLSEVKTVTLSHETLINNALTAYKAITQDCTAYGVDINLWNSYVEKVNSAKTQLNALKLADSTEKVQSIQARINALPTQFSLSDLQTLKTLASDIASLKPDDKSILDLTRYNQLVASYNEYRQSVATTYAPVANQLTGYFTGNLAVAVSVALSVIGLALVAVKKFFM